MGLLAWWRHHLQNEANRRIIGVLPNARRVRFQQFEAEQQARTVDRKRQFARAAFSATAEGQLSERRAQLLDEAKCAQQANDMVAYAQHMQMFNLLLEMTSKEYAELMNRDVHQA